MSKITVTTIAGLTSGGDANKVKIESGDDFNVVSGKVGIGTVNAPSNKNTVTPTLNVSGSGVNGAAQITRHTSVGGGGALLHLSGTRGSDVNSYTILQNNDGIGTLSFQGADGNEFVQGAAIQANVDGTPGDNDMPTRLSFRVTADGASTSTERMRIHNGGVVSFSDGIELGSGLDATAANTLDDYEEGTWTPFYTTANNNLTLNGNASTTASMYTTQSGSYIKIGRKVICHMSLATNGVTSHAGSGNLWVGGLPFTTATTATGEPRGVNGAMGGRFSSFTPDQLVCNSNATTLQIRAGFESYPTRSNLDTGGSSNRNVIEALIVYSVA